MTTRVVRKVQYLDPQSDFERGLTPAQLIVYRMLQMVGNGTVQPNAKRGSELGSNRLREWVDAADRELGI